MEIDQRFHAALADFGLIGRVRGVPGGIFQNIAQDHAGHMRAVIALADETLENPVFAGDGLEFGQCGGFGCGRRQVHGFGACNAAGHDRIDQGAARGFADHRQHHFFILRRNADVARDELGGIFQLVKGEGAHEAIVCKEKCGSCGKLASSWHQATPELRPDGFGGAARTDAMISCV
jgi:hypothetical protein